MANSVRVLVVHCSFSSLLPSVSVVCAPFHSRLCVVFPSFRNSFLSCLFFTCCPSFHCVFVAYVVVPVDVFPSFVIVRGFPRVLVSVGVSFFMILYVCV